MTCRICLEPGGLTRVCACKGTMGVHLECLEKWMDISGKKRCEVCKKEYRLPIDRHELAWYAFYVVCSSHSKTR